MFTVSEDSNLCRKSKPLFNFERGRTSAKVRSLSIGEFSTQTE